MTKEQKILLLFVLAVVSASATFYVTQQKNNTVIAQVQTPGKVTDTTLIPVQGTTSQPSQTGTVTPPVATIPAANRTIKETLSYNAPENHVEEITVTAVVDANGNIVDVLFAYSTPSNRESRQYLEKFSKSFTSSMVVGKKIGSINLSRVGGASLTTNAFNQAIANIGAKLNG